MSRMMEVGKGVIYTIHDIMVATMVATQLLNVVVNWKEYDGMERVRGMCKVCWFVAPCVHLQPAEGAWERCVVGGRGGWHPKQREMAVHCLGIHIRTNLISKTLSPIDCPLDCPLDYSQHIVPLHHPQPSSLCYPHHPYLLIIRPTHDHLSDPVRVNPHYIINRHQYPNNIKQQPR